MERKYYSDESPVFNVEVELDKPYRLDYYTLTSCQDYPERDPKSWVVEGFDKDWEAVSEVNGFVFPCRYATMKFAVNGTKLYNYSFIYYIKYSKSVCYKILYLVAHHK